QDQPDDFSNDDNDAVLTTMLVAGNVGLLAGALGGSSLGWSTRDAWTVHLSGIAGLIGGLGIDLLASVESTETGLLIPGLTSVAALGVAAAMVSSNRARASSSRSPASSLIDFAGGRWSVGMPMPMPAIVSSIRDGQSKHRLGAQVSLVRMVW
ncbi:MAG: hypothetical protein WBW88_04080, partial [Rhodothermales bacterium]